jgi:SPP1 gp7 family putative phage head morphogenesis protein
MSKLKKAFDKALEKDEALAKASAFIDVIDGEIPDDVEIIGFKGSPGKGKYDGYYSLYVMTTNGTIRVSDHLPRKTTIESLSQDEGFLASAVIKDGGISESLGFDGKLDHNPNRKFKLSGYLKGIQRQKVTYTSQGKQDIKAFNYWRNRQDQIKGDQLKQTKSYQRESLKRLNRARMDIEKEIETFVKKYADEDGNLSKEEANKLLRGKDLGKWKQTLKEWEVMAKEAANGDDEVNRELNMEYYKSQVKRLDTLKAQITQHMGEFANTEITEFRDAMGDIYENTYYRTIYEVQDSTGAFSANFEKIDRNELDTVLETRWQGSNFSNRVWDNTTKVLPQMLTDSLNRAFTLGYGVDEIVRQARVQYGEFTNYKWHRLVTTEMAHIAEQATLKSYEESGIDEYEWSSTWEAHTCEVCGNLDGKTFRVNRIVDGVNYPPKHPNCRCSTVPSIFGYDEKTYGDDDVLRELSDRLDGVIKNVGYDRGYRDPNTGEWKVMKNATFNEWKKVFVEPQKAQHKEDNANAKREAKEQKSYNIFRDNLNSDIFMEQYRELKSHDAKRIKAVMEQVPELKERLKLKQRQSQHIKGDPEYDARVERDRANGKEPSYFNISDSELYEKTLSTIDIDKLFQQFQFIDFGEEVGVHIDKKGKKSPATRGKVHQAKDGIHVVPEKDRKKKDD